MNKFFLPLFHYQFPLAIVEMSNKQQILEKIAEIEESNSKDEFFIEAMGKSGTKRLRYYRVVAKLGILVEHFSIGKRKIVQMLSHRRFDEPRRLATLDNVDHHAFALSLHQEIDVAFKTQLGKVSAVRSAEDVWNTEPFLHVTRYLKRENVFPRRDGKGNEVRRILSDAIIEALFVGLHQIHVVALRLQGTG